MKQKSIFLSFIFICIVCFQLDAFSNVSFSSVTPAAPKEQTIAREKPKLLLYYLPWCPYSQRVLNYLKQIHKTVPSRNLQNDPKGKEELKKIGGKMQVPCLIIDGKPLYESEAIVTWLSNHKQFLDPA
jgi:glutaredoxin 3